MEPDMLGMAAHALANLVEPTRLLFLSLGVLIGLAIGVIPGLGGLVGLSLLLPFTFDMDAFTALAFLTGLSAVTVTSDTIPAVLFGVPGTVGSAATVLDGYPMAKRGEAGRAFGAAFAASVLGGLFGAFILGVSVPVLRPLMLNIGSPELFAVVIFGLSLVAVLSGNTPIKGLVAACIGLLISMPGLEAQTGLLRWSFGTTYLWDGVPVVPLALGLFAIPELADLAIRRASIVDSGQRTTRWQQLQGMKDVLRNKFLLLRCSAIGCGLGAVPGLGVAVIDWIAYGHAARTCRNAETFGHGDVRGVIASEASNNAKEGGALVPTIAFGVPGSASMAILLGAFLIHGLVPGPEMLSSQLDVTYTLVWSVAIANILGGGICFLFANQLAKIAQVRFGILVAVVAAITYVGAFQGSNSWGDLYILLGFGVLGWIMKQLDWPRPPLVLGFVLGALLERYLFISVTRYGAEWLLRPAVIVILALAALGVLNPLVGAFLRHRRNRVPGRGVRLGLNPAGLGSDLALTLAICVVFGAAVATSVQWPIGAGLLPQIIGWTGFVLTLGLALSKVFVRPVPATAPAAGAPAGGEDEDTAHSDEADPNSPVMLRRAAVYFAWCLFLLLAALTVGLLPAMLLFMIGFMRFVGRESWPMTLAVAIGAWLFAYVVFHQVLTVPWPPSLLSTVFPSLKELPFYAQLFLPTRSLRGPGREPASYGGRGPGGLRLINPTVLGSKQFKHRSVAHSQALGALCARSEKIKRKNAEEHLGG